MINNNTKLLKKAYINRHIMSVHEKKPFQFNICDDSFAGKANLNNNVASVHGRKKPFRCNSCDASFGHQGVLNRHISSVHEKKNPSNAIFVILALH